MMRAAAGERVDADVVDLADPLGQRDTHSARHAGKHLDVLGARHRDGARLAVFFVMPGPRLRQVA
jgi:hypothetical protein